MSEPQGPTIDEGLRAEDLREIWSFAHPDEKVEGFRSLSFAEAEALFLSLDTRAQSELLTALPANERQLWVRQLPPDDAADLCQMAPAETRESLLRLLDEPTRKEVSALLAYAEDEAGGLMSPRYVRLRPDMSVDEAIKYLRRAARERAETIYYIYVLDSEQRLALLGRGGLHGVRGVVGRELAHPELAFGGAEREQQGTLLASLEVFEEPLRLPRIEQPEALEPLLEIERRPGVAQVVGHQAGTALRMRARHTALPPARS